MSWDEVVNSLLAERLSRIVETPLVETQASSDAYQGAFEQWMRHGRDGLDAEQQRILQSGHALTTAGEGYLIPESFRAELQRAMQAFGDAQHEQGA